MRISRNMAAVAAMGAVLFAGGEAAADTGQEWSKATTPSQVRWDDFDDPSFDPAQAGLRDDAASKPGQAARVIELGPAVVDSEGQLGRIHRVVAGDTLWDISEAYLGTPWVWPSVWRENEGIDDPHLIEPDDRIWISSTEMRRLTPNEADELLASQPTEPLVPASEFAADPSVDPIEPAVQLTGKTAEDRQLSLASSSSSPQSIEIGRTLRLSQRGDFGYVSDESFKGASSIVGSPSVRTWLAGGDLVYLGLGEGEVELGQEFTIFRDAEPIYDVETGIRIGYHINVLGWARVLKVESESAVARVINAISEIERGDHVTPRDARPPSVAIKRTRAGAAGHIVYMPASRTVMGMGDYLYLNRGEIDGLEIGSELEVFERGFTAADRVRGSTVHTRDEVVATLVVVSLEPRTAVAFVTHTRRELEVGNSFRTIPPSDSLASLR